MARWIAAAMALVVLGASRPVCAQTAAGAPSVESPGIGAAGAIGLFGDVGAIRLSAPVNGHWGVDATVGHVTGRGGPTRSGLGGASVAVHVRWMRRGRDPKGRSGYWLFGPMLQQGTTRTEIRWPNHVTTVVSEPIVNATLQVGYGRDWLFPSGARFGVEISTGGNERGPSPFFGTFLVWGKPRR